MRMKGTYSIEEIKDALNNYSFCYHDAYDYFSDEDEIRTIFIMHLCCKDSYGCCDDCCVDGLEFKLIPAQNDKAEPWEPKRYYLYDIEQNKRRLLSGIINDHERDSYWMEHYREEIEEELRGAQNESC